MSDLDGDDTSIDITPVIDVIFMLLIFFIMTTTFSRPVLDIMLPSAETSSDSQQKGAEMIISVKADGSVIHEDRVLDKAGLTALLSSRTEDLLNLFVDEKAPFEAFVSIIDIARKHRDGRFVISTRSSQD